MLRCTTKGSNTNIKCIDTFNHGSWKVGEGGFVWAKSANLSEFIIGGGPMCTAGGKLAPQIRGPVWPGK